MNVQVSPAAPEDAPRLAALLELYVYDFSEMLGLDVGANGRFAVPRREGRHAFLFRVDGKLAGCALVEQGSRIGGDRELHDMAEFFVLRRHRRLGVGEQAALAVFAHFPGRWEVRQRRENPVATAFWQRIIERYTGGRYESLELDDARWRGPVQRFVTPAP